MRNTGQMGETVLRRSGERMRQSQERVWSSSLELEAVEQEVMRRSPDRGPRDLEVTAAAAELTMSAPAACVRARQPVGGSVSVCARAWLVSLHICDSGLACGMCMMGHVYGGLSEGVNVPLYGRSIRECLCLCVCACVHACMCVGVGVSE